MGKSEIIKTMIDSMAKRNNTIDLNAYAQGLEDMFDHFDKQIKSFNDSQDSILNITDKEGRDYSQSPTELDTEFDTLQPGDWFQGTEEDYRRAFEISGRNLSELAAYNAVGIGYVSFAEDSHGRPMITFGIKLTQLTAPEFIRRAGNTFKNR